MRQVCVKITVPDELEPRVVALSRRLGVSFDIMVEILMAGHVVPLRASIASAERILDRDEVREHQDCAPVAEGG